MHRISARKQVAMHKETVHKNAYILQVEQESTLKMNAACVGAGQETDSAINQFIKRNIIREDFRLDYTRRILYSTARMLVEVCRVPASSAEHTVDLVRAISLTSFGEPGCRGNCDSRTVNAIATRRLLVNRSSQ